MDGIELQLMRLAHSIALGHQAAGRFGVADAWYRKYMRHAFWLKYRPWLFEH